ncbi:hypothetical protein KP509_1Z055500 [Ceratopteris richardii]|nr:hypothetical protein KP509_1Z055500 [Ceratopteris richardii]
MKKKNRAWDAETAKDLLKDETTRSALRGLSINSAVTLPYEATKYESLPRLLFLRVIDDAHGGESLHGNNFAGNVLKSLRCEELRLLVWRNAPFGELPSGFCSTNLRLLDLRSSSVCEVPPRACFIQLRYLDMAGTNISSVPHGISFDNLEHMDLSSTKIKELPSGVRCPNLRRLDLSNTEICQVPHGLYSKNLEVLRLSYTNISKVPEASLTNLLVLELGGCKGLKSPSAKFSASMTSLQHLDLSRCGGLEGLDASIGRLTHLRSLLLSQCHRLMCVPQEMTKLSSLVFLDFKRCPSLQTLSFLPTTLRRLRLMGCRSLQTINASLPNLEILSAGQCTNLKRLPTELGACMRELDLQGCDGLEEFLPTNQASFFGEHSSLEHLFFGDPFFLRGCTSLETLSYLPTPLRTLSLGACNTLQTVNASLPNLQELVAGKCTNLKRLPREHGACMRKLHLEGCDGLEELLPTNQASFFGELSSLVFLDFKRCPSLQTLSFLPTTLRRLRLMGCRSLQTINASLPNLEILSTGQCTNLKRLPTELGACMRELDLQGCDGLEEFLPTNQASFFGELSSLEHLFFGDPFFLRGCTSLETLSYLPTPLRTLSLGACNTLQTVNASLPNLQELVAGKCTNLKRLPREHGACMRKLHLEGCDGLEELLPTNQASFFGDTFFDMKKKNRAWDAETAKDLLKDETTRSALRGLSINSAVTLPYEATKYESLPRLLFLRVIDDAHGGESLHGNNFAGNVLKSLRCEELRLLVWRNAPFGELPSGFCSTNLRLLDLRSSSVCEVPPRACFIQLRYLDMAGTNISSVPHGISFDNLEHMDLSSTKIKELPSGVRCPNLRRLDLSNTEICQVPHGLYSKNLEVLRLSYTNISKVPVGQIIWVGTLKSIKQIVINHKEASLTNLLVLELGGCKGLKSPSAKFSASMTSLQHLDLSRCGGLEGLDASIGRLTHLRSLLLSQCHRLMCVPQEMTKLSSLVFLDFKRCPSLQTLSFLPTTLRRLRLMGCRSLQTINASLPNLEILSAGQCTNLKRLPTELGACMRELDLQGCDGLEEFLPTNQASFFGEPSSLEYLSFGDFFELQGCTSLETLSYLPTTLRTLRLSACSSLQNMNASLPNLQELDAAKCTNLKRLPRELGACIRRLYLQGCDGLEELLPTNQASFFGGSSYVTLPVRKLYHTILERTSLSFVF